MNLHIPQGITVTTHDSTKKWWKVGEKKKEHASVHISTLASGSYLSRASSKSPFNTEVNVFSLHKVHVQSETENVYLQVV